MIGKPNTILEDRPLEIWVDIIDTAVLDDSISIPHLQLHRSFMSGYWRNKKCTRRHHEYSSRNGSRKRGPIQNLKSVERCTAILQ